MADVVEASDKWADVSSARLGDHERLVGREAQSHVGANALCGKCLAGFQSFFGGGQLDDDVLVPLESQQVRKKMRVQPSGD